MITPAMSRGMAIAWRMIDLGGLFIGLRSPGQGWDQGESSGPEHQFQVGAVKSKGAAYLVFEIAFVRVVYQFRIVYREKKGRRIYPNLL